MEARHTNKDIREAILKKRLRYYEVAQAMGVSAYTFSHWLEKELPEEKKNMILNKIDSIIL